jgi:CheY-like chemotaxis protein
MGKVRIFVANDDQGFLAMMRELLESEDYTVTLLKTAQNAYEEITRAIPDLLILDITFEYQDAGWYVLENVKLNPNTTKIPVIVCSGDMRAVRAREADLTRFGCMIVEKPFDIETMLSTITQALG